MRLLLAVLRDTEEEGGVGAGPQERAPMPSLAQLGGLVDHVRESGVPVETEPFGTPRPVPPGVELSAYRIVQEALTNVLKHARPSRAQVTLTYEADALEVRITDDGVGGPVAGSGHGLVGIRERAAVVGGEVVAGPRPEGGFEVAARLPYAVAVP